MRLCWKSFCLRSLARLHKFAGNEIHLFSPRLVTTAAQLSSALAVAQGLCRGRGHAEVNTLAREFHAFACQCLPDISFIRSGRQQLAFNYFKLQQAAAALDVPQSRVTCTELLVCCLPLWTVANMQQQLASPGLAGPALPLTPWLKNAIHKFSLISTKGSNNGRNACQLT